MLKNKREDSWSDVSEVISHRSRISPNLRIRNPALERSYTWISILLAGKGTGKNRRQESQHDSIYSSNILKKIRQQPPTSGRCDHTASPRLTQPSPASRKG